MMLEVDETQTCSTCPYAHIDKNKSDYNIESDCRLDGPEVDRTRVNMWPQIAPLVDWCFHHPYRFKEAE